MSSESRSSPDANHIAFYLPSLRGGGAERVIVNLANEFAERGYSVDIVLVQARGEYLADVSDRVNIIDLDTRRFFGALPQLVTYLKRERPDVLLSTIDTANIVAICAKRISGVSTRVVIRISNMLSTKEVNGQLKHRLVHRVARYVYPYANAVVAVSDGVADDLLEMTKLAPEQITTIYNPSVTDELLQNRTEPIDHPWFVEDQDIPIVLGVGELSEQKDFQTLIRAFDRVVQDRTARLVILGEGPRRDELEALIEEFDLVDSVSIPGFVDNPYAYMSSSDVFVLSSQWEGCPNVLIEALACNVPVVSTNCPSGPEEILESGEWGSLVDVGDHENMAKSVISTLDQQDPIDTEQYARSRFSVEEVTNEYRNLIEE
ncbi:glycosyltransferase [Halorubrum cibi]|uniref:Glycosyltransferase involved in cell wall bisynthesis n=1 Tax=Halorubrum cibi TaxID=413815 RepID=A0A521F2Y7_9EURY|nr:glycosyltransferase [Halorubrum cibi]SMO90568.1 Glycosyltransferase involved in cell wall bisynthesis [Halorubrum cibi]